MFTDKKILLPLLLCAIAGLAQANEKNVQAAINQFIGVPSAVTSVNKFKHGGLYEVVLQNEHILYTDEKVSFVIEGRIIDTANHTDLTRERMDSLNKIAFEKLPFQNAIKMVKGNGNRLLVTFEDPMCGFCKRLQKEIEKMDNITVYTFLYPVLGKPSVSMSTHIWCAKDRKKTWLNWMLNNKRPPVAQCNDNAIKENLQMGEKKGIHGTPVLMFADGRQVGGYIPQSSIEHILDEIDANKK